MKRGWQAILPLAFVSLLVASCAGSPAPSRTSPSVDPSSAIVLSVLADAIYLVDPVTGDRTMVVDGLRDFRSGYAVWSPDHRRIVYSNGGIFVIDVSTGDRTDLVPGEVYSAPTWSLDGKRVAYGNGADLYVLRGDSTRTVRLRLPKALAPFGLTWGPDATIAFGGLRLRCDDFGTCVSTERSEIWTVRSDGSNLRQLTRAGHAERPKWSPDGSMLLFVRRPTDRVGTGGELWVIRPDGTKARMIPGIGGVVAADWSPDGQRMAIVRQDTFGTLQVWIAAADGSNAHPVGGAVEGTEATVDW